MPTESIDTKSTSTCSFGSVTPIFETGISPVTVIIFNSLFRHEVVDNKGKRNRNPIAELNSEGFIGGFIISCEDNKIIEQD
jgi:hypothetical protein